MGDRVEAAGQWRVFFSDGSSLRLNVAESDLVTGWIARGPNIASAHGNTAHEAALNCALKFRGDVAHVLKPGTLTAHEQVEAETERCAGWVERLGPLFAIVAEQIRSGEEPPR